MKIIKSDIGVDYYGRYDESGQHPCLFTKFLKKRGIYAQYIMSGAPQPNIVSKRCNWTLMNMVRSMLSNSCLLISLWMYASKAATYLLNTIPNKVVQKTPFEL